MNATPWRKSSRSSGNAQSSQCVEARALWRKSSRSSGNNNSQCVEARTLAGAFQLRDSKLGDTGPILTISPTDYTGLLHTLKH